MTDEVRVTNAATGGVKGQKAERFSLLPRGPLAEVARLYGFGASKYEAHNWRKGYDWSLSADALERHLAAFLSGEFYDEESGCHHLASVVFHAFSLMEFTVTHPELDDVTPDGAAAYDATDPVRTLEEQERSVLGSTFQVEPWPARFQAGQSVEILVTPGVGDRYNGMGLVCQDEVPGSVIEVVPCEEGNPEGFSFLYEPHQLRAVPEEGS